MLTLLAILLGIILVIVGIIIVAIGFGPILLVVGFIFNLLFNVNFAILVLAVIVIYNLCKKYLK